MTKLNWIGSRYDAAPYAQQWRASVGANRTIVIREWQRLKDSKTYFDVCAMRRDAMGRGTSQELGEFNTFAEATHCGEAYVTKLLA